MEKPINLPIFKYKFEETEKYIRFHFYLDSECTKSFGQLAIIKANEKVGRKLKFVFAPKGSPLSRSGKGINDFRDDFVQAGLIIHHVQEFIRNYQIDQKIRHLPRHLV